MRISPIAVVILTVDQRETTLRCLESLGRPQGVDFDVLVWDNGSADGTAEAVREAFPDVAVHRHPENLGVASGRNAAAARAAELFDPAYLLFLDNDMVVEAGFVGALHAPFEEDPTVGQTQAKLRFADRPEVLNDGGGCHIRFWLGTTEPYGKDEVDRGQRDRVKECVCCGGAMMVRADLFRELGGFDSGFDPFGPEDLDFSLRLQAAGHRALYVPRAVAYHALSHTFGAGYTEGYARLKVRHWFRFMRRQASPLDWAGFLLVGAPYRAVRLLIREGRRGNLGGLRGAVAGAADLLRGRRSRDVD